MNNKVSLLIVAILGLLIAAGAYMMHKEQGIFFDGNGGAQVDVNSTDGEIELTEEEAVEDELDVLEEQELEADAEFEDLENLDF